MDHERAAADRGAVYPFEGGAEITRDRDRRLDGGRRLLVVHPTSFLKIYDAAVKRITLKVRSRCYVLSRSGILQLGSGPNAR
jgi:hypothetical protein